MNKDDQIIFNNNSDDEKEDPLNDNLEGNIPDDKFRRSVRHKPQNQFKAKQQNSEAQIKKKVLKSEKRQDDEDLDEVDFESIIQTKMIERKNRPHGHSSSKNTNIEEASPSWFNIQNQRFDADDDDQQ